MKNRNLSLAVIFMLGLTSFVGCKKSPETTQKTLIHSMDEYHRVLRPLMHQALPEKNVVAFKENAEELLKCAERLATAEVPPKFENQKTEIDSLVKGILEKTKTFQQTCKSGTEEEIFNTFMTAHDDYEALADIVYEL